MNSLNLPELDFAITDSSTVLSNFIDNYKNITNISLSPADPVYNLFSAIAYTFTSQRAVITNLAKQTFLSYMTGEYLDNWGANFNCSRLSATYATTSLTFTLSEILEEDVRGFIILALERSNSSAISNISSSSPIKIISAISSFKAT